MKKVFAGIIAVVLVLLIGAVILSVEFSNRNPYFEHLSQSEKALICSSKPEDIAKLYFEALHEKNYELAIALFHEEEFQKNFVEWTGYAHFNVIGKIREKLSVTKECLFLVISSKYRAMYAEKSFTEGSAGIDLEKITDLTAKDISNEPLNDGSLPCRPDERLVSVSFILEKGRFLVTAPPLVNIHRFVYLKLSQRYNCFLIEGIGTSP